MTFDDRRLSGFYAQLNWHIASNADALLDNLGRQIPIWEPGVASHFLHVEALKH